MNVIDLIKEIIQLLPKVNKLQEENTKLRKQLHECQIENETLKNVLQFKETAVFENKAYWIKKKDGSKEGPFCPRCWEQKQRRAHMVIGDDVAKRHQCACGFSFYLYPENLPQKAVTEKDEWPYNFGKRNS